MGAAFRRILSLLVVLFLVAPLAAAGTAPTVRSLFTQALVDYGLDPEEVLAAPADLLVHHADGRVTTGTMTLEEFLHEAGAFRVATTTAPGEGAGVGGTPEIAAGDLYHVYVNFALGSALAYDVSQSAFAPSTPPVFLPEPATPVFFDVGGPLYNVKASNYLLGGHTAGSSVGSNVDTHATGPYLPVVHTVVLLDSSFDFVGHAAIEQLHVCFFGICVAAGTLIGTGVAVIDDSDVQLPRVP